MKEMLKKYKVVAAAALAIVLLVAVIVVVVVVGNDEEITYRETEVQFGSLTVGVSESGSVDIGTVDQTFDLDMSALQRATTSSGSSSSSPAGMGGASGAGAGGNSLNMFDQIFNMAGGGGSAQSGDASSLTVSKVCVSVGQQIQEGDALYEVDEDSVAELTEELETNVEKAKADLDAVYADQVLSKQTAQYTYDSSTAYGSYAQTEYNTTITQLQQTVTDKEKELQRANESLEDYKQQLEEITAAYNDAEALADSVEWGAEHTDKSDDVYNYVQRFQQAQTAKQTLENLEQKKDRLEQNVEQAQTNVEQSQKNLNEAKRNLAQGLLSASQTLSLRQLAYDTAQETYDIALAYLEDEVTEQEETYADAAEKWEEYSSYIDGNTIRSQYSGVITGIDLDEGDLIQTGSVLVTLYDMDDVTMTVTLYEEDMTDIALGSAANIVFTAYPDEVFQATVTEISDATTTSSGYVTYDVTVTLEGDVSGLFQGMTGDITFITEQTQDVLYVSRRALITEGDDTYVKVRGSNGKVQKVKVTTGFTDGVYTEITEGLSEGDVVLIESKTTK